MLQLHCYYLISAQLCVVSLVSPNKGNFKWEGGGFEIIFGLVGENCCLREGSTLADIIIFEIGFLVLSSVDDAQ